MRRLLVTAVLVAAAVLGLGTGTAHASCPSDAKGHPTFARWGDKARYVLAEGGSFEQALGWSAVGEPSLVAENNPFRLAGKGSFSARLTDGQSLTSPVVCVSGNQPYLRFVARALDRASRLVLEVLWTDMGVAKEKVLEEHPADLWQAWGPSKIVPLGTALPTGSGEVHQVRLRFSLKDGVGSWLIDDVFIDPIKRG